MKTNANKDDKGPILESLQRSVRPWGEGKRMGGRQLGMHLGMNSWPAFLAMLLSNAFLELGPCIWHARHPFGRRRMCYAQTAAPEVKKAKRRKMQKRGYCWNQKHYVMKPSGGWWTGRGALSKKPPVLPTTIENWQHKAFLGQGVTTALGILRFETCAAKGVPKHNS